MWGGVFISLYGWIASNANVAISADYFNRDALGWNKGGRVVTTIAIIVAFVVANFPPWVLPNSVTTPTADAISSDVVTVIFFVIALYAAAVIALSYRRISDKRIKKYTLWVMLSIISVFALISLPGP